VLSRDCVPLLRSSSLVIYHYAKKLVEQRSAGSRETCRPSMASLDRQQSARVPSAFLFRFFTQRTLSMEQSRDANLFERYAVAKYFTGKFLVL